MGILLDGGFPGRQHGIIPYSKPKNIYHPTWQAKYKDGHSFILGHGESIPLPNCTPRLHAAMGMGMGMH